MPFLVTVHPEVTRVGDGTRRRAGFTFSSRPQLLMVLPPEVAADAMLIVEPHDDGLSGALPQFSPPSETTPPFDDAVAQASPPAQVAGGTSAPVPPRPRAQIPRVAAKSTTSSRRRR